MTINASASGNKAAATLDRRIQTKTTWLAMAANSDAVFAGFGDSSYCTGRVLLEFSEKEIYRIAAGADSVE